MVFCAGKPLENTTMEMRPSFRCRADSAELIYPTRKRSDAPSLEDDSDICVAELSPKTFVQEREIRDVVEEVRHELLTTGARYPGRFDLLSNEDIMDSDSTLWTPSLLDGEESSARRDDIIVPMRDFKEYDPPTNALSESTAFFLKIKSFEDRSQAPSLLTATTFQSDGEDSSQFSSSCLLPVFDDIANDWRDSGLFCCSADLTGTSTVMADRSNAIVETAATKLLHDSVLQSADDFFSDHQAKSLQETFSEVSEEFDVDGHRVVNLTAMISMRHLCVRKDAVDAVVEPEVIVQSDASPIPNEVTFKVRVLSKLNSNAKKKRGFRPKRKSYKQKDSDKKGMFGKFKGRFRKGRGHQ